MILCRPTAHGSYYVQARGTNDALTMEVLHIIRAVYDNVRDPAAKKTLQPGDHGGGCQPRRGNHLGRSGGKRLHQSGRAAPCRLRNCFYLTR